MRVIGALVMGGAALVAAPLACSSSTCQDSGTCAAAGNDAGVVSNDGATGERVYPDVPAPTGCDPTADPSVAPACVADSYALFVDGASGSDTNPGTQSAPLKTIMAAMDNDRLAGRRRVYVCATPDPYVGNVVVRPRVSLVGGFVCQSWTFSDKKTIVSGTSDIALKISNAADGVSLTDFDVRSADASAPGGSSIAVFVSRATVIMRRMLITAGNGLDVVDIASTPENGPATATAAMQGVPASGPTGGIARDCKCPLFGSSHGGKGGDAMVAGESGASDPIPPSDGVYDGAGGGGGATCLPGHPGPPGAPGVSGAKASTVGAVSAEGWKPTNGGNGTIGGAGRGGGGGGGAPGAGGGGGGCGGCGGAAGVGGKAGGSSIALLMFESAVVVSASTLTAGNGGSGGPGANGGDGTQGGEGTPGTCGGGAGGNGSGGGGGAGGSGGIAAPIVRKDGSLTKDNITVSARLGGAGGKGGAGGHGATNSTGVSRSGGNGDTGQSQLSSPEETVL